MNIIKLQLEIEVNSEAIVFPNKESLKVKEKGESYYLKNLFSYIKQSSQEKGQHHVDTGDDLEGEGDVEMKAESDKDKSMDIGQDDGDDSEIF